MSSYTRIPSCRLCGNTRLTQVFDAGDQYVVAFPQPGDQTPLVKAPLVMVECQGCGLAQLEHTVERDLMYADYGYRSGVSGTMRAALGEIARRVYEEVGQFQDRDVLIDIGSNDSTLLQLFRETIPQLVRLIGFEPAKNIGESTLNYAIIKDYFNAGWIQRIPVFNEPEIRAKVITAIAMFYDVPDPLTFLKDVADLLTDDGIFVCQMNYLPEVLKNNAVDFFSHEHLTAWDAAGLEAAAWTAGLDIFHVELLPLNGGTARFWLQLTGGPRHKRSSIKDLIRQERQHPERWSDFEHRVRQNRWKLCATLAMANAENKVVGIYGASTRLLALLQYCDLNHRLIAFAADRDPLKWGRYMAGVNIPIISEAEMRDLKPDYLLIGPYSYLSEFLIREKDFLKHGGKFIVPVPEVRTVGEEALLWP